jgi:hypothetical protein
LAKYTIVISYYAARSDSNLSRLIDSLVSYPCDLTVVVNTDAPVELARHSPNIKLIVNNNVGMNIGAWNRGFLEDNDSDFYIFLQDECYLRSRNFLEYISDRFDREHNLGMMGESLNQKWAHSWASLRESPLNHFEDDHYVNGVKSRRVDTYLCMMEQWGINPGGTGSHLRSLVWAFPGAVLRELGGFPIGQNKGECIAAEIAVSRRIADMGLDFDQFALSPFTFFGHLEWRLDGSSKISQPSR